MYYDPELQEYVLPTEVGEFYGAKPQECFAQYYEALRVASDHARKNPQEARR